MKKKHQFVILIAALFFVGTGMAKAQQVDYKYHTVFIYNFTKYIKWPEASIDNEFIIGVLGKSGITEHLQKMAQSKLANGKPIVVKTFNNTSEITGCHMLFLPEPSSGELSSIRQNLARQPILIISEKAGLGQMGSDINFIVNNGRWNFELNQASADMHKLKISGELSKFAHKVYTEI